MHLKFVETESTFDYFQATREYLEAHGKPVAFYSDKHGVFRVNSAGAVQGDGMTQFGRSLHCINGHPAPRAHNITYAGLPPRHGYQRDHRLSLCLGGTDTADNVRYQPIGEARHKDKVEWYLCEQYCAGRMGLA